MLKIKKAVLLMLLLLLATVMCSGCMTPAEIYEKSKKYEATDEQLKALAEGKLTVSYDKESFDSYIDYLKYLAASYITSGSQSIKQYAVPLGSTSIAIGLVLMGLGKRSMRIRKFALFVFVIGIPAFIICLIYAAAFLADAAS